MNTKLVNEWKIDAGIKQWFGLEPHWITSIKNIIDKDVTLFIEPSASETISGPLLSLINELYEKAKPHFEAERWIELEKNTFLDKKSKGFWKIVPDKKVFGEYTNGTPNTEIETKINSKIQDSNTWIIPCKPTLKNLTALPTSVPFGTQNGRPKSSYKYIYKTNSKIAAMDCDEGCYGQVAEGVVLPFLPLYNDDCSPKELFIQTLECGFIPSIIKNEERVSDLIDILRLNKTEKLALSKTTEALLNSYFNQTIIDSLLKSDHIRSDLAPYNEKLLNDTELGHWSLWQDEINTEEQEALTLPNQLVARDPKSDINDGVVAIDFGTKSTVVVYQKDNVNIHPMRVGTGDLSKEVEAYHYENPTIMEFINLESFTTAYNEKANKPYTRWKDLTISHTAQNSMHGSESSKFNSFLDEIKQWAGDKNRKLKIVGQHGKIIDLPPFLELTEDDFNPIEIYAYYLGLYINNLNNGIFMDYILSFPVTYEMPIRAKIIESFEKGLKKSLPAELGEDAINELSVIKGTSEPAAYALTALQHYGFDPEDDERIFYSVFDFGGGTTDFDFGIYHEPTDRKDQRRFDYVIEHFGAGGDKFLGGENLLELLAFEIFKKNKHALLEKEIQFEKHPEKDAFAGSEQLLSNSQEARVNTRQLCIALRPFWEEHDEFSFDASDELSVTLTDIHGVQHSAFALDIDIDELKGILSNRIERGVENFFEALRLAFSSSRQALSDIDNVKIFLAGNSSQSSFVKTLFEKHIAIQNQEMDLAEGESRFELFSPLGADKNNVEKPTAKTGVAFGLIDTREGGRIKVVDHNIGDGDIRFKYYLGEERKKKFKPLISREAEFNKWVDFTYADYQKFEIFFTEQPNSSTGQVSIGDSSIKKKVIKLDMTDEDALIYLRVVSPTAIEYVIANEADIDKDVYLNEIQRIEL